MNEFEVVEKLKSLASASENAGVTKELQSTWEEWDLVLGEAAVDRIKRKRSSQLDLAGMDFKREQLYVPSVCLLCPESLKGSHRERLVDFFHVCLQPCSRWICFS